MKGFARLIFVVFLGFFFVSLVTRTIQADQFTTAYVRLDRTSPNTTVAAVICAKPATTATEAKVTVTFPTSFTINTTASNWTVDTSNLPSGASSWPGIGSTAQSVSGKTITFSSSDLTVNTLYCFHTTSSSSTTGNAGTDLNGSITTLTAGSSQIDSTTYALSIISSDQLTVSATVPANSTDFSCDITPDVTSLTNGNTSTYTITYGSRLATPTTLTVQASWDQGIVEGTSTPSVDLLDYVVGSASDAYNSTPPVIDTINRTITWTINSFPANTQNQTVTFQLKVTDNYSGTKSVSVATHAVVSGPGASTPTKTVTQTYTAPAPTVTPTNAPSSSSSTPTPTSIPQPTKTPLISKIAIVSLTPHQAVIQVTTSTPTTASLRYSAKSTQLNLIERSLQSKTVHEFILDQLTPATVYFFKVSAQGITSQTSDLFTIKTPLSTSLLSLDLQTLVITADDKILFNAAQNPTSAIPIVVIPENTAYSFTIAIVGGNPQKTKAEFTPHQVLGTNSYNTETPNNTSTDLFPISLSSYMGRLLSPTAHGLFDLSLSFFDDQGNILHQTVAYIRVIPFLTVLSRQTHQPVEHARIQLSRLNPQTHIYEIIPPQIFEIYNPGYTNAQGKLETVLPTGQYKAEITALGFISQEVPFSIGPAEGENFPTVFLDKTTITPLGYLSSQSTTFTDFVKDIATPLLSYLGLKRFFDLVTLFAILLCIFLGIYSLFLRVKLPLPLFLKHMHNVIHFTVKNVKESKSLQGIVIDTQNGTPISNAHVYIFDAISDSMIAHTTSDINGEFFFHKHLPLHFLFLVTKPGFAIFTSPSYMSTIVEHARPTISLVRQEKKPTHMVGVLIRLLNTLIEDMFELTIVISLLLECLLLSRYDVLHVAPLLLLSCSTLFFWIYHTHFQE